MATDDASLETKLGVSHGGDQLKAAALLLLAHGVARERLSRWTSSLSTDHGLLVDAGPVNPGDVLPDTAKACTISTVFVDRDGERIAETSTTWHGEWAKLAFLTTAAAPP